MSSSRRHFYLAFDASCATCREIAADVDRAVKGKVEIRSLRDADIDSMRHTAFHGDAPWAPTLIARTRSGDVRAWTGMRLGLRLAAALGPVATWRTLRALGEFDRRRQSTSGNTLTRKQVIRGAIGLTGLTAGASILMGSAASPALAVSRGARADIRLLEPERVYGQARRLSSNTDLANVIASPEARDSLGPVGQEMLEALQSGAMSPEQIDGRTELVTTDGRFTALVGAGTVGNAAAVAMAIVVDDRHIVAVREFTPEWDNRRTEAMLYQLADGSDPKTVRMLISSTNGDRDSDASLQSCDSQCCCSGPSCGCRPLRQVCDSYDLNCIAQVCVPCFFACGNPVTCVACFLIACGGLSLFTCCASSSWQCSNC